MNILLVESHYRSRTWFKALQGLGDINIISVLPEEKAIFLSGGVSNESILDLHNPILDQYEFLTAENYLRELELELGFCVNEIIQMDRTLRLKDYIYITKYVYHIAKNIREFVEEKNIEIVFIEPTWTHEIIISKICEFMRIPVLAPVKDKILPNRFLMFKGYLHNEHFSRDCQDGTDLAKTLINSISLPNKKPQYFKKFNNRNNFTLSKFRVLYDISKLAIFKQKNINIQPPWFKAVKKKLFSIMRAKYLLFFGPFVKQSDIAQKYVLVTLHVQPEASIDVVGAKYSDQIDFVRQIVRTTPIDHLVVVKEHPHAFGDRDSNFYNALISMPRVLILAPFEESREAIKRAQLVISNTGTSSLEAAIVGVPGVTAIEMYFKDLMVVPSFNPSVDRVDEIILKAGKWKNEFSIAHVQNVIAAVQKNSFEGNSGDFKTDPDVMSDANIEFLRNAFSEAINNFR